jgi:hypothetical protein
MKTATLFEVYTKRAIHEPIEDLIILDRDTSLKKARASARTWGGCVVKVHARILSRNPLTREILASEVVWVHKPRKPASEARDQITRKQLIGKLRQNNKSLYRGFRR